MILGVTGGYCAGKNVLCEQLKPIGFAILDVDIIGHMALEANKETVLSQFGNTILNSHDNTIDRKKLGSIVFSNKKQLHRLEGITHPWMKEYIRTFIETRHNTHIAINAALLYFLELDTYCDTIVILDIPLPVRFVQALRRDVLGFIDILRRFMNQKTIPNKILNSRGCSAEIKIVKSKAQIQAFVKNIGSVIHGTVQR